MFKTRLISGVIMVAIAVILFYIGGPVLLVGTGIISLIGCFELFRVFGVEKSLVGWIGYIAVILFYLNLWFSYLPDVFLLVMAFLLILLAAYVFRYPKFRAKQVMAVFFGFFYVAVMLSYIYQIRAIEKGLFLVWLIFLCSWGCDTCAYCVGKLIGKHKMSPVLSPKKSVEGAVGGVLGAVILTAIFCFIFRSKMELNGMEILILAICGGVGGLISMVGDLAASAIKRNYDIKDYGHLIPGHGGILDRFDSVIITAPIIYYVCTLVMMR